MHLFLHTFVSQQCYCSLYIDPILLHIQVRRKRNKKPVGFELSSNMHMCYEFGNYIYSSSSMTTCIFLVWQTYFVFFSLFMPMTFEILHTCISIQNTNDHEVLDDGYKYFGLVSHIFSFTSMIP